MVARRSLSASKRPRVESAPGGGTAPNKQVKKARTRAASAPRLWVPQNTERAQWPMRARIFKCWDDEYVFDLIREKLVARGWTYQGSPCSSENVFELEQIVKCKGKYTLPRRCLWWVQEGDSRRLRGLPKESLAGARHAIATFMGTDSAATKITVTKQNNMERWYPTAYILPREMCKLKAAISKKKKSHWICKPANECAGTGCAAYEAGMDEFKKLLANSKTGKEFVVQTYVHNPLLVGGFKFHFRMYTILRGVLDKFEAYLYRDGTALFATKPFSMKKSTLGANFDKYMHLTNWSINFTKNNLPRLLENKPVIGKGCEHPVSAVLKMIKKAHPNFSEDKFWEDMTEMCAKTMYKIAQWGNLRAYKADNDAHPRFENFGLDIMMDSNFQIWLMEANTEVGLNPANTHLPDPNCSCIFKTGCAKCRGHKSPRCKQNNKIMGDVISASVDLLGLDVPWDKRVPSNLIPLHPVANRTTMKYWKLGTR